MNTRKPGYRLTPEGIARLKAQRESWRASHAREAGARTVTHEGAPLSIQTLVSRSGLKLINGKVG